MRRSIAIATAAAVASWVGCGKPKPAATAAHTPVEPDDRDDHVTGELRDPASEPIDHEAYAGAEPVADDHGPSAPDGDAERFVAAHAKYRAAHCAPPLVWSSELALAAQAWADHLRSAGCAFEHSTTSYGENLAAGTSGAMSPDDVVAMWYAESAKFDFKHGGFGMDTGHFTQLVWIDTARVGCGKATCNGLDIYVCNYDPPGNVEGEYRSNVKAKRCK